MAPSPEVGCGYSTMLPLLQAEGFHAFGCDPIREAVRFCRSRGLEVIEGTVPGAPFRGPFDVTIAQHLIEHVAHQSTRVSDCVKPFSFSISRTRRCSPS